MKILSLLLDNCRESDTQTGKKIGISGGAVKSRIQKMVDNGVIEKFTLKIEPPVLGHNLFYIVITGQDQETILQQVNLIGIPFNLTRTDLEIIDRLIKDPRAKIEDIAKLTKLSSKTITRSLEKFQRDDTILFTLIYDPVKLKGYIPYAILVGVRDDVAKTLIKLKKNFSNSFLQKPFVAKNQIVLFMYSDDIFKLDLLTQKVRDIDGVFTADLFIPKKINLPINWITDAINLSKSSKKLHLLYQTH